jgi:hypothetical protein
MCNDNCQRTAGNVTNGRHPGGWGRLCEPGRGRNPRDEGGALANVDLVLITPLHLRYGAVGRLVICVTSRCSVYHGHPIERMLPVGLAGLDLGLDLAEVDRRIVIAIGYDTALSLSTVLIRRAGQR